MSNVQTKRGTIAILTGGGDVPGLNPAIRAITVRALREGYRVLGIRRGWAGLIELDGSRDRTRRRVGRRALGGDRQQGGPDGRDLPPHLPNPPLARPEGERPGAPPRTSYTDDMNDLTPEVLANIGRLGIDVLIPIGGDDTLSYGVRLHKEGVKVVALPKTMDNDVPGTDYCIGFSTCVTRTIEMTHALRTSAGSHERFLVIEVFGRYAGFTALLPTMAGAANRCVIPEYPFDVDRLTELLVADRTTNPSRYSVVLVSEGAKIAGMNEMVFSDQETDAYGHKKLGGVGDVIAERLKQLSPKYAAGRRVNTISPAARLPRPLRRPGRPRLDRPDGLREPRDGPDPEGDLRAPRERPERPVRQRPRRRRDEPEEDSRRREALRGGPAPAPLRELREQAALHHDERLLKRIGRTRPAGLTTRSPRGERIVDASRSSLGVLSAAPPAPPSPRGAVARRAADRSRASPAHPS